LQQTEEVKAKQEQKIDSNHHLSVQVIRLLIAISMLGLASNAQSSAMILAWRFQMPAWCTCVEVGKKSTARSWLLQMLMVWLVLTCLAQRNATITSAQLIASCPSCEARPLLGRNVVLHTQLAQQTQEWRFFMQHQCAIYLWFRSFSVKDKFQNDVIISGVATFIAAYHYMRIFNSWVEAYKWHTTLVTHQ